MKVYFTLILLLINIIVLTGQGTIKWSKDGNSYTAVESGELVTYTLPTLTRSVIVGKSDLILPGEPRPLAIRNYSFSADSKKILLFGNSKKVWRLNSRGDYWVLDKATNQLKKLGNTLAPSSLMFAKFSPDATQVAYVSEYNLYVEDLATSKITALTAGGHRKNIYGTFDWVYEEEFFCRDGFQWSPDGKKISFWYVDATKIKDYYMLNMTDSTYSKIIPVEYPVVGEAPSPVKILVADLATQKTMELKIPGDPAQNYLPRMEWRSASEIFVQQLNRKQNETKIFSCSSASGDCQSVFYEKEAAWIDAEAPWEINSYSLDFRHTLKWLKGGKEFLWFSEKDGWRHLYRVPADGSKESLLTNGNFDVIAMKYFDETANQVYFMASPENATQKYLYKMKLDGKGKLERLSPVGMEGTHDYNISPNGKYATHTFQNSNTERMTEIISLPDHKTLSKESIQARIQTAVTSKIVEFFKIETEDGVEMDGWMVKPNNFDPTKKYPVLFSVYAEPGGSTIEDTYGQGQNSMYNGNMREDGYIQISVDGRGTPLPKGREWRKSIYRKIGILNISDQAKAAKEILKWPFVDPDRIAVWGWSGGGATTLNLLFQYPEIYKTGIAVSAVTYQPNYDNVYQERYMGIPQESMADFVQGSPITHAKNLKGNLLYIHGTGDDNVHYNNAEMLLNELIKHNKQFQFMPYPNRTHGISEGEGTREHLSTLYTEFLKKNCPPGPR